MSFRKILGRQRDDLLANGLVTLDTAPSGILGIATVPPLPPPPAPDPSQRQWRPLGPFAIPHGQTKTTANDPRPAVAGRISAIAVDPADATHILAGSGGGGVWESRDRGVTWAARTDTQNSLAIGALAFDPANPLVVYAGTGEGDSLFYLGAGLLRSGDGGRTWAMHDASFAGDSFQVIAIDPLDSTRLLAGTRGGLWESTNSGAAWTQRRARRTWSISFHPAVPGVPTSTDEVFAACDDGLHRSADGGTTWAPVGAPLGGAWTRLAVAHAPSSPDVVLVLGATANGAPAQLFRRAVAAGAFTLAVPTVPANPLNLATGQAFYDWFLAVAPNSADTIYLGGVDVWRGDRAALTDTWAFTQLSPQEPAGAAIHSDQHACAFDPVAPATLYVGNDGGVYRTTDRGATWETLNRGLNITEFEYIAQHPQVDAWLIGGTQDNGSQRYEGSGTWFMIAGSDGGDCAVDDESPGTCYHTYFVQAPSLGQHVERSDTGGGWGSWRMVNIPNVPATSLFYPPLEARGRVVVQGADDVFISEQGADPTSWIRVTFPAPADLVTALEIPAGDRVLAGTFRGRLFSITRAGTPPVWTAAALGALPTPRYVTDILTDPTDPTRIWATLAGFAPTGVPAIPAARAVVLSTDSGTTFGDATGDLPAGLRVWAITADPGNPRAVFIATDRGVFRTTDDGAHWRVTGFGLPNCQVKDLVFHGPGRVLRAATKSRGVWELDVDLPPAVTGEPYVRYHPVDTGRALPAPAPVPAETIDPFTPGAPARWWESPDVKVDAAPHLRPLLADVDFDVFSDDHGVLATGLFHERLRPGQAARVYVQVHNRSPVPATNVDVRVYHARPGIGFPPLPASFWDGFPANAPAAASAWQPVAPAQRLASVEAGRPRLAAFEWAVPADAAEHATLLAVCSPAGTPLAPAATELGALLATENRCALHNQVPLRPRPGAAGERPGAVLAFVHASAAPGTYVLDVDAGSSALVLGAVLSSALSTAATADGASSEPLVAANHPALGALLARHAGLGAQLDQTRLYRPPTRGRWLGGLPLTDSSAEPVVLLIVRPQPPRGRWSVVQRDAADLVRGGLTLIA